MSGSQNPTAENQKQTAFLGKEILVMAKPFGDVTSAEIDKAEQELEAISIPGNANSFVPWADPLIPFECECGAIIYADSEHEH
ncbi:MAG: hypothetical protein AAB423_01770 [Patescibacteria group bacterium]